MPEEIKKDEPKKKGPLGKLRDKVEDSEEQLAILSTFVRLGILVWSGGILTLAYIKLPPALGIPEQKAGSHIHGPVSLMGFTTFGVQTAKGKTSCLEEQEGSVKQTWRELIEKASQTAPAQTIRLSKHQSNTGQSDGEPPVKPTL